MKNKKGTVIVGVILVVVLTGIYLFSKRESLSTEKIVSESVKKDVIELVVSGSGNVQAKNTQNFFAKTTSKVTEVKVKLLDKVKKGDQLVKFDDYDLKKAVDIAQYNFNAAYFRKEQLRTAALYDDNAYKQAQQQVNVTKAQLDQAKNNLNNNTAILAPIDGAITSLNLKVGDYGSLTTPAGTIVNPDEMEAVFNVNEVDITKVKLGQEVVLDIDAIDQERKGIITSIDSIGVNVNGVINYSIKSTIEDVTNLKPLMSINANIKVEKKEGVITIPTSALKVINGKNIVQIVKKGADLTKLKSEDLESKEIVIGLNNNSYVEVLSGVTEGDNIVTSITKQNTNGFGFGGN